jgi:hypothetical protein
MHAPRFQPMFFIMVGSLSAIALSTALAQERPIEAPPTSLTTQPALARKEVDLGTHKVTYIRIVPPRLPVLPSPTSATPATSTPTAEEKAAEALRAAKTPSELSLSVTVYVGTPTVTELTWWDDGRRFRAWSNADFRLLTRLHYLETAAHVFFWTPLVTEGSVEEIASENRPTGQFLFTASDTTPEFYFEGTEEDLPTVATTLIGLDYLHAYYQIHRQTLAADYARDVAEAEARAQELVRNPPKSADTTIYFWKMPTPSAP